MGNMNPSDVVRECRDVVNRMQRNIPVRSDIEDLLGRAADTIDRLQREANEHEYEWEEG